MAEHDSFLTYPRGQGFADLVCVCGEKIVCRPGQADKVFRAHRVAVNDVPDLPIDPTGRNWALPRHLTLRRP